jgi:hypothetical protein
MDMPKPSIYFVRLNSEGEFKTPQMRGWQVVRFLIEYFRFVIFGPWINKKIDTLLMKMGAIVLEWPDSAPTYFQRPDLWHDSSHPGLPLIKDLLEGWLKSIKRTRKKNFRVLVVGDSTIAYNTTIWTDWRTGKKLSLIHI